MVSAGSIPALDVKRIYFNRKGFFMDYMQTLKAKNRRERLKRELEPIKEERKMHKKMIKAKNGHYNVPDKFISFEEERKSRKFPYEGKYNIPLMTLSITNDYTTGVISFKNWKKLQKARYRHPILDATAVMIFFRKQRVMRFYNYKSEMFLEVREVDIDLFQSLYLIVTNQPFDFRSI